MSSWLWYDTWTVEGTAAPLHVCSNACSHHTGVSAAEWPGECTAGIHTLYSAPDAGMSTFLLRSNGMQGEQQDRGVQ